MGTSLRVLIVEDSDNDMKLIVRELRRSGFDVTFERVETQAAMTAALDGQEWDVILSDFSMPDFSAPAALKVLQDKGLDIPFIIVSGTVGEESVVAAMKAGAQDYFSKQKLTLLVPAIERELHEADERRMRRRAEAELRATEERFRLLLESAPEAIIITDKDGHILLTNAHTETIFGYTSEELKGQSIETLMPARFRGIHPAHRTGYMAAPGARLMGVGRELWGLRKDGSEFPIEVGLSAVESSDGLVVASFVTDISARKKVEDQLRYQALLLTNVSDAVMSTDMAFRIRTWNHGSELIYGWKAEEVVDKAGIEILETGYREGTEQQALQQLMEQGEWKGEVIQRRKDGSPVHIQSSVSFVTDANGERIGVVAVNRDITERKQAEVVLRQSEERFSKIFHASPVATGISRLDDSRIVDVNDAYIKMLGYGREELIGHTAMELNLWIDPEQRNRMAQAVREHGSLRNFEAEGRTKSGEIRDLLMAADLIDLDGEPHIVLMIYDITDRKRAEAALRKSEESFSTIFHQSPIPIAITTMQDQRFVDVNAAFLRMCGYDFEEIIGRTADQLSLSLNITQNADVSEMLEQENVVYSVEMQYRTKSGQTGEALVSIAVIELAGEPCIISFAHDITERKRIEQEKLDAERLRAELESDKELLKLKERFISIVSHEFRTPLSVIMSSGELVQRYHDRMTAERQLEHIHEIIAQSSFMTGMLDDVLTFNKASAGKMEFNPALLDLKAFCRSAIERIESADHGKHQFNLIAEDDFDGLRLDQKLLQHIVLNLLSNAAKYSPAGGEVRLEVTRQDGEIVLRFSDQGIGIPPEAQARLFEPFHRAENVGSISGTGLGLAIVKESVDLHGGTIICESEVGVGTTFTVRLPAPPTSYL